MRYYLSSFIFLVQLMLFAGTGPTYAYDGTLKSPITIANPGGPLNYYLALITVDTAAPIAAGTMRADGGDIRFIDDSATEYNFWIESGLNTATTKIWVKVPELQTGYTTFGYYYGDATATHGNDASNVFGSLIRMLYTFTEGSGTTVNDWVGGHDLTLSGGAAWTDGPRSGIGAVNNLTAAAALAAASNGYDFGTGDFTIFAIVNPTAVDVAGGDANYILSSYDGTTGYGLKFQNSKGGLMFIVIEGGSSCQNDFGIGNVSADVWSMVSARRWSGVYNSLFHNSSVLGDFCENDSSNVTNNSTFFHLGGRSSITDYDLNGSVSMSLLFSRNLSDAEIADLSNALMPSVQPTVTLNLSSPKPVASSDNYTTVKNTLFAVSAPGVLKNDIASGGHSLTAAVSAYTAHGTLSFNSNGSFIYKPDADFTGTDTFAYSANDGVASSNTGTVTVTVTEDNNTCSLNVTPIRRLLSFLMPLRVITISVPAGSAFPMGEDINWGTYAIKTLRINPSATGNQVKALVLLRPFQLDAGEYDVRIGTCEGILEVQ